MVDSRDRIRRIIETDDKFLVAGHENPDGDALGASVALGHVLQRLGKEFRIFNASGVPEHFAWMDIPGQLVTSHEEITDYDPDWFIIVDCGDPFRMGKTLLKVVNNDKIINIDHHMNNPMFGAVNWVDPSMSAVGEMVALLADDLDIPLTGGLGEAVYLAIVSDTGNFSYSNTRPATMEIASKILRLGLLPGEFNAKIQNQWSRNRLKLWSSVLGGAEFFCDDRIGVIHVSQELLDELGATKFDCDGLVESVRRVRTTRVAMFLREDKPEYVKFSLRSEGKDNVQKVAMAFNGGGHRNAAGGHFAGSIEEAKKALVAELSKMLDICPTNDHQLGAFAPEDE